MVLLSFSVLLLSRGWISAELLECEKQQVVSPAGISLFLMPQRANGCNYTLFIKSTHMNVGPWEGVRVRKLPGSELSHQTCLEGSFTEDCSHQGHMSCLPVSVLQVSGTAFVRVWSCGFGVCSAPRGGNVLLLLLSDRRHSQSPCSRQGRTLVSGTDLQLSSQHGVLTRLDLSVLGCRRAAGCGGVTVCVLVIVCV